MKRIALLIIVILSFNLNYVFSQRFNTREGYIINTLNDTLKGYIKDEGGFKKGIRFRSTDDASFRMYGTSEIKGFFINDNSTKYVSFSKGTDSLTTTPQFVKVLSEGYISLYYTEDGYFIADKENKIYIIEKQDDKLKRVEDDLGVRTIAIADTRYIGMVKFLISDYPQLSRKINNLSFTSTDISKVINLYNNWKSPSARVSKESVKNIKAPLINTGLKISVYKNAMSNVVPAGLYHNVAFAVKTCFAAGLVVDFNLNRKFSLQVDALLAQRNSYLHHDNTYGDPEDIKWAMTYMEFPVSIYYTLPTQNFSPHFFAGGIIGAKIADNSIIQTIHTLVVTKVDPLELGFLAGTGVTKKIKNNSKIRIEYYFELVKQNIYTSNLVYRQISNNLSLSFIY